MSGSVNRVILVGNCTRDPEVRTLSSGGKVCNLSVATNDRWTDKASGEKKDRAEFHRIVIFDDRLCDVAEKYLAKGSKVYIEGELQTRKWQDQSGNEKFSTEVVLRKFRGQLTILGGFKEQTDDEYPPVGASPASRGDLEDEIQF